MANKTRGIALAALGLCGASAGITASWTLHRIVQRHLLRVCTTGDYQPFSYCNVWKARVDQGLHPALARGQFHALYQSYLQ